MKISYLMNIASSLGQIGYNISTTVNHKISGLFEEHFIKGRYVSREEYEVLQDQINKLRKDVKNTKL